MPKHSLTELTRVRSQRFRDFSSFPHIIIRHRVRDHACRLPGRHRDRRRPCSRSERYTTSLQLRRVDRPLVYTTGCLISVRPIGWNVPALSLSPDTCLGRRWLTRPDHSHRFVDASLFADAVANPVRTQSSTRRDSVTNVGGGTAVRSQVQMIESCCLLIGWAT